MLNSRRTFIIIIITFLSTQLQGQNSADSLFYNAKNTFWFNWSSGDHVSEQLIFHKDTNLFLHTFREHLLTVQIKGTYEFEDSLLTLKCISGCEERITALVPIIVPTDTTFSTDTLPVFNSAMNLVSNSFAIIKRNKIQDTVLIYSNNRLTYSQPMKGTSPSYLIKNPTQLDYYIKKKSFSKSGFIKNGNLTLDGKFYPKPKYSLIQKSFFQFHFF